MKNRIIILVLFGSQFLAGCIAFIPPYHRSETVVIIEYPDPAPVEPPYRNPPPDKPAPPPNIEPEKPIKERPHKNDDSDKERKRRSPVSDPSENRRNSGERSGR